MKRNSVEIIQVAGSRSEKEVYFPEQSIMLDYLLQENVFDSYIEMHFRERWTKRDWRIHLAIPRRSCVLKLFICSPSLRWKLQRRLRNDELQEGSLLQKHDFQGGRPQLRWRSCRHSHIWNEKLPLQRLVLAHQGQVTHRFSFLFRRALSHLKKP